jgi:23S rRNA pseudouridine2605 synthase
VEERVQRALARAGLGSRRSSEDLIREGRVQINGKVATLGDKVDPEKDTVAVDGTRVPLAADLTYLALNKPQGVVTTAHDPQGRRDLREFFPPGARVFAVGRLDRDTEGLLLMTNDGALGQRLMHPRYGVEKEYLAEVEGELSERALNRIVRGIELEDGLARAKSAHITAKGKGRAAVRVVMTEGRKREVRRLLAAVGLPVTRLVRTRVGPVRLHDLPPGEVRPLSLDEIRGLFKAAGL